MRFKKTMICGLILGLGILECDARFRSRCGRSHSHHSSVRAKNAPTAHAEPHTSSSSIAPFIYGAIAGHALTSAAQTNPPSEAKTLEQTAMQPASQPSTKTDENKESFWSDLFTILGTLTVFGALWWVITRKDD